MEIDNSEKKQRYIKARRQVEEIKGFYINLVTYCVVIPFLIFINYKTHWDYKWFWWPMLGWGLGLVLHGFNTFGYGKDWEERKINEIMNKDND